MPIYSYSTKDGSKVHELFQPMGEKRPATITIDGEVYERDVRLDWCKNATSHACYPYACDALGVAPDQRQAAYEESVKAGAPTQFTESGQAIITDKKQRRVLARSLKLHDRNAGYSDPTPD